MIGIFGGTFDPVHYGHIKPALSVKQALNLTQLRFIPNRIPPHRETPWLSIEQRLAILHCALDKCPDVLIDDRELKREGPSYMVDTLKSLQLDFPDEKLCLIIGMDVFFGITSWFEWRAVFDLCDLVVTTRPGFEQSEIKAHMSDEHYAFLAEKMTTDVKLFILTERAEKLRSERLLESPLESSSESSSESPQSKGQILLQSVPQLDISSTQIRDNIHNTEKVSQWMPQLAYQKLRGYINDN